MLLLLLSLVGSFESNKQSNSNNFPKRNNYFSKYEERQPQLRTKKNHKNDYFAKTIKIIKPSQDNKNIPGKESIPYWKDIDTVAVNKEKPRTAFVSFDDVESAIQYVTGDFNDKSPYYQNLNGKWRFYYVDYPRDLPENITDKDVDPYGKGWSDITVPGNWEMQGYGIAMYTNVMYDFNPRNPSPPNLPDYVPVGVYYRTFTVPKSWIDTNRDIYLQVGGAKCGLYVYINGVEVGYSEESKSNSDFKINSYIQKSGENILTLKVYKHTSGSYMEDQDMWRLGGIERDVYIYSQPITHIRDFNVIPTLNDRYDEGIFKLNVSILNDATTEQKFVLEYQIFDKDNKTVVLSDKQQSTVLATNKTKISFHPEGKSIPNIRPWSAEHPNLYTLVMKLSKNDGTTLEVVSFRIGFRRIEYSIHNFNSKQYPVLLFNGKEVKYKGVNIHEHDQYTGRYVTDDTRRKDIELMKQFNFNSIRLCHYPNARRLYELCDELGLYIVSEMNIETHAMGFNLNRGGTLANNLAWFIPHLDRTINGYLRTRNYASVNLFSLGNEAGNGINFERTYLYLKKHEKLGLNRSISYERAYLEFNSDNYAQMYYSAATLEKLGKDGTDRPVILWEYSHAMGNSNGNFDKLWNAIYTYPNLQGGFIWDWVDQGILEKGKNGKTFWAYGGDYGEGNAPSDGNFNINGLVGPDRMPHPACQEVKYMQQDINFELFDVDNQIFKISNRFHFTNLDNYEISYSICKNGDEILETKNLDVHLQPETSAYLIISWDHLKPQVATEYFVNFSAKAKIDLPNIPKGYEVAHAQFKLPIESLPKDKVPGDSGPELKITVDGSKYTISSSKVHFEFHKDTGLVTSYQVIDDSGEVTEFIHDNFGFQPNFWRSPTDNDYGNGEPKRQQIWKTMSHNFQVSDVKSELSQSKKKATLVITYQLVDSRTYEVTYSVYSDTVVKVHVEYHANNALANQPDIPRIGLRFRTPVDLNSVTYYGLGPHENYWDRKSSGRVSEYTTTADDMYTPYVRPQENGHRSDVRWMLLQTKSALRRKYSDVKKFGLLFAAENLFEFNALRNTIEDFDDEDQVQLAYQFNNADDCFHTGLPCNHNNESAKNNLRRQHHVDDIVFQNFVEVNIDYKMMGLAGYDSWGDKPLPEHTLPSEKDYTFGFTIFPIDNKQEIREKLVIEYD